MTSKEILIKDKYILPNAAAVKWKDGNHVLFNTVRGNPSKGDSRGIVKFTRFATEKKKNVCFITVYSAFNVQTNLWEGVKEKLSVIREEDTLRRG